MFIITNKPLLQCLPNHITADISVFNPWNGLKDIPLPQQVYVDWQGSHQQLSFDLTSRGVQILQGQVSIEKGNTLLFFFQNEPIGLKLDL